jgi:hypothetical protein
MSSPYPSVDPTFGPLHLGNTADDDGQVIDSLLVEVDAPPAPQDLIGPISPEPLIKPRPVTRLNTGNYTIDTTWGPVQVVPADPNRLQLRIRGMSNAATPGAGDYILLGYDRGMVGAGNNSAVYKLRNNVSLDLDEHTGEVWVAAQPGLAANTFEISYLTVTEGPDNDNDR